MVPTPPPPPPVPSLPASLKVPCQSFPLATDDTVGHLLANHDEVATLGRQCRDRNASLLDATDEWLATAWQWYCQAITRATPWREGESARYAACVAAAPKFQEG
jgi:hypothetical protein